MRSMSAHLALAALLPLAACTGYAPPAVQPGQSVDAVVQGMGPPTGRHALPGGGSRLEFARGPYGKHTYMIDADAAGRVLAVHQVLTEANFATIAPGMGREELLSRLGRPSDRRGGGWQGGEVWSWRYDATFCQWFQVGIVDGRVRDAGYAPDPLCDVIEPGPD